MVHVYMPPRGKTWWIRYTLDGVQHRTSAGHTDESEARVFAATTAHMVGLAQDESFLDEKQRLFEVAHGLLKDIRELEGKAESPGKDRNLPTVRQWFNRRLDEMKNGSDGDDCPPSVAIAHGLHGDPRQDASPAQIGSKRRPQGEGRSRPDGRERPCTLSRRPSDALSGDTSKASQGKQAHRP